METKIKTIEDAFIAEGLDPKLRPDVSMLPEEDQKIQIANFEIDVWVRALNNEGQEKRWVPDYKNPRQPKYEHVYYMTSSGWSLYGVHGWHTFTNCGARRVFRTREIARYAWEKLQETYKVIL